jgi:hypothetical protein
MKPQPTATEETPMAYAPIYPHDPIEEIGTDVFMARGSIKMNPIVRITRNMGIIRQGDDVTLVNPIRLNADGEKKLKSLGNVRHVIRLGAFHGVDDPYYVEQFRTEFWSQAGGTTYTQPNIDHELSQGSELPISDGTLFCFQKTVQPESALLINRYNGILFTCDAVQHYGDYRLNNLPAKILLPLIGFPKKMLIGPIWLKEMTPEGGTLKDEFERLLEMKFDSLLSAHGSFLASGAHEATENAFSTAYPD